MAASGRSEWMRRAAAKLVRDWRRTLRLTGLQLVGRWNGRWKATLMHNLIAVHNQGTSPMLAGGSSFSHVSARCPPKG